MNYGKVRVKFLKDYEIYGRVTPKDTIKILHDWAHKEMPGNRKDWANKIVECCGHGEFVIYEPGVDVTILELLDTEWEFV